MKTDLSIEWHLKVIQGLAFALAKSGHLHSVLLCWRRVKTIELSMAECAQVNTIGQTNYVATTVQQATCRCNCISAALRRLCIHNGTICCCCCCCKRKKRYYRIKQQSDGWFHRNRASLWSYGRSCANEAVSKRSQFCIVRPCCGVHWHTARQIAFHPVFLDSAMHPSLMQ